MVWKPGQSGNAGGRSKGSKDKLQQSFVRALATSFELKGVAAIDEVIKKDPAQYLKLIASILPKELEIRNINDDLTDEQLAETITALQSAIRAGIITQAAATEGSGQTGEGGLQGVH